MMSCKKIDQMARTSRAFRLLKHSRSGLGTFGASIIWADSAKQGLADKYNRGLLFQDKSRKNLRPRRGEWLLLMLGSASFFWLASGTSTLPTFGSMLQLGH
jgi:hypothetical protein